MPRAGAASSRHALGMDVSPFLSALSCIVDAFNRTDNTLLPRPVKEDLRASKGHNLRINLSQNNLEGPNARLDF